jgi:hypothetical protein
MTWQNNETKHQNTRIFFLSFLKVFESLYRLFLFLWLLPNDDSLATEKELRCQRLLSITQVLDALDSIQGVWPTSKPVRQSAVITHIT